MEGLATKGGRMNGEAEIAKAVGIMFMSRDFAHRAHLKTPSYSKHMALNEFYDGIVDLADNLAEGAQGLYGKLDIPVVPMSGDVSDPIAGLSKHLKMIEAIEAKCTKSYLGNILQEIIALYYSTLYKLTELA